MRFAVFEASSFPVSMRLRYESADPYAVHAVFRHSGDEAVEWVFARELLTEGLKRPVGFGDVRVWPIWSRTPYEVGIALASGTATATLTTRQPELRSFLKVTEAAVPPGAERRHLDLDTQLARILANG
ncbi:SsgA family sporulation/cell division regulator [Streptomyces sp. NPDC004012]